MAEVRYDTGDRDSTVEQDVAAAMVNPSGGYLIPVGARDHVCKVPDVQNNMFRREPVVRGDMWECWECRRIWIYLPIPWEREWVRLRWFMFIQRSRLRHFKKRMERR